MRKIIVLLSFMLLVPVQSDTTQYGGTLHLGYTMDIQTLDPHRINIYYEDFDSSIEVVNQIFEGLVTYKSGTGEIQPLLAESWDISKDGLVYTFHLRKNCYWHDGNDIFPEGKSRPVTADDFVYSWNRETAVETLSPMRDFFTNTAKIQSWQSTGRYTFEVTLNQPNPSFLYVLPFPSFSVVPEESKKYSLDDFSLHAVGSGPFEVKSWPDLILKYNEDYWKGEPFITEIEYKNVRPETISSEFEKETIDWCLIPSEYWDEFISYDLLSVPQYEILYLGMNCQKEPFTDRRVRQAINYALDPGAAINEIYKGKAVTATSILPPGFVCHSQRDNMYPRSIEKAIQLLDEAGYTGNPRLTIELKSSESYIQQQFNELYKTQLKDINVDLQITYLDVGSLLQAVDTGNTQMYTMGWYVDWPYPDQFLFLFHSSNWGPNGNGCYYLNKTVDQLLKEAGSEPDISRACSLFKEAEDMILEDSVWVLQWRRVDGYAVQEWINNFSAGGMGTKYEKLNTVWISPPHRQTTRIPQTPKKEFPLFYAAILVAGIAAILIVVILRKKGKKEHKRKKSR
ncbi:MAG: ABC transporter substrate-binding protein [Theionarchaea archaeon]|nr:ABC transporter substrate-binding protein [Theionarchaea archaeon]